MKLLLKYVCDLLSSSITISLIDTAPTSIDRTVSGYAKERRCNGVGELVEGDFWLISENGSGE